MKPAISKDFIFEYFRGKATSIQKQLLDNWIKDPENEEIFYQYLEEWERLHPQYVTDVSKGKAHFKKLLKEGKKQAPKPKSLKKNRLFPAKPRLLAASVALVLITTLGWLSREPLLYSHYRTSPGEIASYLLPDGSQVTLNANSRLKVSRLWRLLDEREVFLSGEAEFHVAKNKSAEKFIVKTDNNVEIVVLGTIFTVFNRHQRTEVALNEGKVKLMQQIGNSTKSIEMVPGDKVLVGADQQLVYESGKDFSKATLWKHNRFEFDQTSLESIAALLKDHYDLEAVFNDLDTRLYTISGSFVAINADEFLESLCLMNGLQYQKAGEVVKFYREE